MNNTLKPKIYFIKDVEQITRRNRLTLRRWWKKGKFPIPKLINSRIAWSATIIDQWVIENIE